MNNYLEKSSGIYIMVESYELNSKGQTRKLNVILESSAKLNLFFRRKYITTKKTFMLKH
mgnify:CR=1 FL=1